MHPGPPAVRGDGVRLRVGGRYVRLLAAHPYVVAAVVAAVTGACVTLAFTSEPLPDFSDPMLVRTAVSAAPQLCELAEPVSLD